MRVLVLVLVLSLVAFGAVGCGGDEPADDPVDAREGNVVTVNGLRYRVVLFRQLNPNIPPDDALYEGPRAGERSGIYAAFVRVCNESTDTRSVSDDIHLEDAFGEAFPPHPEWVPDRFELRPVELEPGECLPAPDSVAEQTFDGAALVFEVPIESARERPLILEIQGEALSDPVRIQLDL